ncbi:hypothetical protein [Fluviicola sp.]|uniref:toxin-antitoxin system YwqK family antitoxin n=1 Tax=Fluviicola sp. TaxID=1917219 RepID=UPI0031E19574
MRRLLPILFFTVCSFTYGQSSLLNTAVSWFNKTDKTTIDNYLKGYSYQFLGEKDSLNLHLLNYSLVKTENGTQPFINLLISDTALEFIAIDTYGAQGQQAVISGLKSGRFKSIGTDINGNFITTTYDNGTFLVQEDYEAVANPLGKGEIAYFRYRVFRKYGKFDQMNGGKTQLSENGENIRANYKNGVLDGERIVYFPGGTIKRTENYRAGRLNGTASDYNSQGKLIHSSVHSYHWKYGMEKWYNNEGKVVKSLQWQRDIPVGTEKQTYNGQIVGSVSYVKGLKQGLAKVPVYSDPSVNENYTPDTLNDAPLAIETVNYQNGQKSGKAICMLFHAPDTMYVAYYKAGKLDSIFTRYGHDGILYTTTFQDGLEHGTRIYRIPSGLLKDTVYRVENFKNGKLDGQAIQYYQKGKESSDSDPGYHTSKIASDIPAADSGKWFKSYQLKTYKNGILNGPYSFWIDSMRYDRGNYVDGKLHGVLESSMVIKNQYIRLTGEYTRNVRTGEWITQVFPDSIVTIEHFDNNRKHGTSITQQNGFITQEAHYYLDNLKNTTFFTDKEHYQRFELEFQPESDTIRIVQITKKGTTTFRYTYQFEEKDYPHIETLIDSLKNSMEKGIILFPEYLNGDYTVITPFYERNGSYHNGKDGAVSVTKHLQAKVYEKTDRLNHSGRSFTTLDNKPYSGTFISALSREQISVKNGLLHGWCVEYDIPGKEVRRIKYKNGILKKIIESN